MNQAPALLPRWADRLFGFLYRRDSYIERSGDLEEAFIEKREESGPRRAAAWLGGQILKLAVGAVGANIAWRCVMWKNHLKIAYRNILRFKLFSFINIFGLAVGLAVCLILSVWVERELSYDRFHGRAGRIFRVERELFRDNMYSRWPICSRLYKDALLNDFPEIENAARVWRREMSVRDQGNVSHRQSLFAVDGSVFQIFDFPLEEGDPLTALAAPKTVVLTRKNAWKYLGTTEAVGRTLSMELNGEWTDFRVTGILREVPPNSHIQFDMLMSFASYPADRDDSWRSNNLYTYVLVRENTAAAALEAKLKSFVSGRLEPHYGDLLGRGLGIHDVLKMHLFPVTDIHLHPSENWELEAGGSRASVTVFSLIAVLILIIAGMNFVNLSTARSGRRAKEVGLRKTLGAANSHLRRQFLHESLLVVAIALAIAVGMSAVFLSVFNRLFADQLSLAALARPKSLLLIAGITLAVGLLAGLYPAFHLARFEPAEVSRRGAASGPRKTAFRRVLVTVQFGISITLLIGMLTVSRQMSYIQSRPLGFQKENVVLLPLRSQAAVSRLESFRNELLKNPRILSMAASSDLPGEPRYSNTNFVAKEKPDAPVMMIIVGTDDHFIETLRIPVLSGRAYSRTFGTDAPGTIMLNETAARRFGWTPGEAVGKEIIYGRDTAGKVVGVVDDFNFRSLHTAVEPLALLLYPGQISDISVRFAPGDPGESLAVIRGAWEKVFPEETFEFGFLDQRMDELYARERKMRNIFVVFAALSIGVACLGLVGLAAFTAEIRTKEIGIRKALGASTENVLWMLSRQFLPWIALANAAAWPVAGVLMNQWLRNFAYRTTLGWPVFLSAGAMILILAASAFGLQAFKAASVRPAKSLRYE